MGNRIGKSRSHPGRKLNSYFARVDDGSLAEEGLPHDQLLSSINDLRNLSKHVQILPHKQITPLLGFRQLSREERKEWEDTLALDLVACGCKEGAVFMVITLLGYLTLLVGGLIGVTDLSWRFIVIGAGAILVSGFVGKLVGLVLAQIRLRYHLAVLTRLLERTEYEIQTRTS